MCHLYNIMFVCVDCVHCVGVCSQVIDPQKRDPYEEIEILMRYDHPNIVKLRDVRAMHTF